MDEPKPIKLIRFDVPKGLEARVKSLINSDTGSFLLLGINEFLTLGLDRNPHADQALDHYCQAQNLRVTDQYRIGFTDRTDIRERKGGVELPSTVLDNPSDFYREVIPRMLQFVGSTNYSLN